MISILYVDDEPLLPNLSKLFLERLGNIVVIPSVSARNALDLLVTESCDAIISDYQMLRVVCLVRMASLTGACFQ